MKWLFLRANPNENIFITICTSFFDNIEAEEPSSATIAVRISQQQATSVDNLHEPQLQKRMLSNLQNHHPKENNNERGIHKNTLLFLQCQSLTKQVHSENSLANDLPSRSIADSAFPRSQVYLSLDQRFSDAKTNLSSQYKNHLKLSS